MKSAQRDETPTRIAAAAVEVFAERGYAGASVRHIARRAGLTEGALYRHFAGKEALAREVYRENIEAWSARLEAAAAGAGPSLAARLDAMARFFCAAFDDNRALFAFLLLGQHGPARLIDPERPNPLAVIEHLVATAIGSAEIPPGRAEVRAAAVLGAVLQPALLYLYRHPDARLADHADEIAAAAIRAAGADPLSPPRRRNAHARR